MAETERGTLEMGRFKSTMWGFPFVLGLLTVGLGIFALIASSAAGLASVVVFGIFLIAGGIAEIVFGFQHKRVAGLALPILDGILSIVAGVLLVARPVSGLAAVSLVLALYFLASGLFRSISSAVDRYSDWGWDLVGGLAAMVLGIIIISSWPISSVWVVGTLVGVDLIFRGSAMMGASLGLRRGLRSATSVI